MICRIIVFQIAAQNKISLTIFHRNHEISRCIIAHDHYCVRPKNKLKEKKKKKKDNFFYSI